MAEFTMRVYRGDATGGDFRDYAVEVEEGHHELVNEGNGHSQEEVTVFGVTNKVVAWDIQDFGHNIKQKFEVFFAQRKRVFHENKLLGFIVFQSIVYQIIGRQKEGFVKKSD